MLALAASPLSFSGAAAAMAPARASVSMRQVGEIGVTPPLGVYDPLNLIGRDTSYPRKKYDRLVELEIKHGRISMLACLGVITTEAGFRFPGYLSKTADLQFADVPGGALTRARERVAECLCELCEATAAGRSALPRTVHDHLRAAGAPAMLALVRAGVG